MITKKGTPANVTHEVETREKTTRTRKPITANPNTGTPDLRKSAQRVLSSRNGVVQKDRRLRDSTDTASNGRIRRGNDGKAKPLHSIRVREEPAVSQRVGVATTTTPRASKKKVQVTPPYSTLGKKPYEIKLVEFPFWKPLLVQAGLAAIGCVIIGVILQSVTIPAGMFFAYMWGVSTRVR